MESAGAEQHVEPIHWAVDAGDSELSTRGPITRCREQRCAGEELDFKERCVFDIFFESPRRGQAPAL